ncbi:MAG: ParM/StbA family protein [Ktedonobacteraceae bacterium]
MTYPMFAYGHDFGNSETCAVASGRGVRVEYRMPSITADGTWQEAETSARGLGKTVAEILADNHCLLSYELRTANGWRTVEKYLGQVVFDFGKKPQETRGDISRYWSNGYSLEMLMGLSGMIIQDQEYGLHVVTGLPIATFQADPSHAEKVQQALLGDHTFRLNGRERLVHVLSVKVIMEGAGALIAYGTTADQMQGVVDIGGRTTDLFVAKGQRPRPALCKGEPLGVAVAADKFNARFQTRFGRLLTLESRLELMRQYVNQRPYDVVLDARRERVSSEDLNGLIDSSLREVGQTIATFVATAWTDSEAGDVATDLTTILLVGGGAHYFAQDIQARLPHATLVRRPEMANAQGYANLADIVANRARLAHVS